MPSIPIFKCITFHFRLISVKSFNLFNRYCIMLYYNVFNVRSSCVNHDIKYNVILSVWSEVKAGLHCHAEESEVYVEKRLRD